MAETKPGRFCDSCVAKASNNSEVTCEFEQKALKLVLTVKKEMDSGERNFRTPSERFSTLSQIARNSMHCTRIPKVCAEVGPQLNPKLANHVGIRIAPPRPYDPVVDYITSKKSKSDRS